MKDHSFSIKISDLLNNPWTKDTVSFTDKFSTSLPQLVDKGITATINLMWLSSEEIDLEFLDVLATFQTSCDSCWQQCRHTVKIKETYAKWAFSEDLQREDIIMITERTKSMDVENFLVETITLASPVVISCKECSKKLEWISDDYTEENKVIWK